MKFLHIDFRKERRDEEVETVHEDHFHGYVSIRLESGVGVKAKASIQPDNLEDVAIQMLNFVRQVAEDLMAKGEVHGDLVYDWDKNRYSDVSLKSESGLPSELPLSRGPLPRLP